MTTTYRPLVTNATPSFVYASALLACSAAIATSVEANERSYIAPLKVFVPAETKGSKVEGPDTLPVEYKRLVPFELSDASVAALGADGVERLQRFQQLKANWDAEGARPLDADSLAAFSQFFRDTDLKPAGLAVFMSREGNVTVNWLDAAEAVIELEFTALGVHFFFESNGEEGIATPYAVASFLQKAPVSIAA